MVVSNNAVKLMDPSVSVLGEQQAQCGLDLRHVTVIELVGTYPAQVGRIRHNLLPPGLALQLRYSHTHTHTPVTSALETLARSCSLNRCIS